MSGSMAMAIPLLLDFMAQMLNLGGIADRIQKIIERVRKPIDQILDKIIAWISKKVKKLFGGTKGKKSKQGDSEDEDKDEKGDGKLTKVDRKLHKQYVEEIEDLLINYKTSEDLDKAY